MIQNTRYLLGKILVFLTNFHSLVKQIIAHCKFFLFSQKQSTFLFIQKVDHLKGSMDAIFSLPLNVTQTNLLSRFCTRHKSNKSEEKMMLRRCATAIGIVQTAVHFGCKLHNMQSDKRVQERKENQKNCGNQYSISI